MLYLFWDTSSLLQHLMPQGFASHIMFCFLNSGLIYIPYYHHPRKFPPAPFHSVPSSKTTSSDFSHHILVVSIPAECTCSVWHALVPSYFWEASIQEVGDLLSFSLQHLVWFAIYVLCFSSMIVERGEIWSTCSSAYWPCCLEQMTWLFQTYFLIYKWIHCEDWIR